jgi:hypothetical protein
MSWAFAVFLYRMAKIGLEISLNVRLRQFGTGGWRFICKAATPAT